MIKNYILDTNVIIHDPNCFYNFEDNNVIIPIVTIEELDNIKNREGMVGYHARMAARELNHLRSLGNLEKGIRLDNGGTLRIELNHMDMSGSLRALIPIRTYKNPGHRKKPPDGG
jgi:PhoH-like ATPase